MGISVKLCFVDEQRSRAVERAKCILKRIVEDRVWSHWVDDVSLTSESGDCELNDRPSATLSFSVGEYDFMYDGDIFAMLAGLQNMSEAGANLESGARAFAENVDCLVEFEDCDYKNRYRRVFDAQGELLYERDKLNQNYDWTNKDYGKKKIEEFIPTWMIRKTLNK